MVKTHRFYNLRHDLFAISVCSGICNDGYGFNPYEIIIYRNMAVFLELADLVMIFAYMAPSESVRREGYYRDFVVTC